MPGFTTAAGDWFDSRTIFVWEIPLTPSAETVAALKKLLTDDEVQKAERFIFPIHQQRFIVARGVLRHLLGTTLSVPPDQIRFQYSPHGKPALIRMAAMPPVTFNVSHSGDLALCAIAIERELGIDVEAIRTIMNADRMATRYFAAPEIASYQKLSEADKRDGFFIRWTLKEAYIKACGEGLSMPLDKFSIACQPDATGFHPLSTDSAEEDAKWGIQRLQPPAGYIAAIVAEGFDWTVTYRRWV